MLRPSSSLDATPDEIEKSHSIDDQLREDASRQASIKSILILGEPKSGKTTLFDQAFWLHGAPPALINPMWDAPVRVALPLRLPSARVNELLESKDSEGDEKIRRVFSTVLEVEFERVSVR